MRTAALLLFLTLTAILETPAYVQRTATTAMSLTVGPQCQVSILSQTPGTGGPPGQTKTQTVVFQYKVRTGSTNGTGQILMSLTTTGSRNYANGSKIDYTSAVAGPITAKSGTAQTNSALASGIVIGTFGANARTARSGATGTIQFTQNPAPVAPFGALTPSLTINCQ